LLPDGMTRHQSVWQATAASARGAPLDRDLDLDACVVGAGIAGLTTAYLLAKAGKRVAVLDDGPVGGGMTQMTSAHLSYEIDDFYSELEKIHGTEGIRLAAESHLAAIDRVEAIAQDEGIDCDFERVDGYLFLAEGDSIRTLDDELAATHRAGLLDVSRMVHPRFGECLRFPNAAQFHPLKYLNGLMAAIERHGGRVYSEAHAEPSAGGLKAGRFGVRAQSIVFATNAPINDRVAIHTKQAPYMTYVIGLRVPRGTIPSFLAWDTGDPYHYVRVAPGLGKFGDDDVLVVGGEDHKSGQADDQEARYAKIEAWARARFPEAGAHSAEPVLRWGGQVMETMDYLAFSGKNPGDDNVYIHTGDSGMGLTHATLGAMIISDGILGRENRWARLYDPARKPLGGAKEFLSENLNVARQYANYLAGSEVQSADEVPAGEGAVMRRGVSRIAIYKEPSGNVVERSAVCPHLGCIVQWNRTEKTWDCPCHGSRFSSHGRVINGPANRDLDRTEERRKHPRAA
jgi:glycine/D-amino acid oxidase-like deaminating enzyme/nitrite reductase/ring-hydroxylating ferredoxin subunit